MNNLCRAGSVLLAVLVCACVTNPVFAGQYSQDFNAFAVGATNFGDGSQLFSSETGIARVEDTSLKELQLSSWDTTNITRAAFLLPELDPNTAVSGFSAGWVSPVYGNFPSASLGFSFSLGALRSNDLASASYAQERGFDTGLTFCVQTFAATTTPGWYVRLNGAILATVTNNPTATWGNFSGTRHAFQVSWDKTNGLSASQDGVVIFTNVPTPGFVPQPGNGFAWATRCGAGIAETFRIDNISVTTHTVAAPIIAQPSAEHNIVSKANISAQINARGLATTVISEVGTNTSYGTTITNNLPAEDGFVAVSNAVPFSVDRTATLHARITASNALGSVTSGDLVFQTSSFERRVGEGTATPGGQVSNGGRWLDINDDGWLDLAASGENQFTESAGYIFINGGQTGAWALREAIREAASFIVTGDFNNDNRPDTFWTGAEDVGNSVQNVLGTRATILYGVAPNQTNQIGTAAQGLQFPYYLGYTRSIVADFDHDGRQDIVFAGRMQADYQGAISNSVPYDPLVVTAPASRMLRNEFPGARIPGFFSSYFRLMPVGIPALSHGAGGQQNANSWYMSAGDLDGDGFPEIYSYGIIDAETYQFSYNLGWGLYRSDGDGGFATITTGNRHLDWIVGGGAASVWADFNGDGRADLLVAEGSEENYYNPVIAPRTQIFLNDGQGGLTNSGWQLPPMAMASVAAGDIFNHGRNDILVGGFPESFTSGAPTDTYILRNDGGGVFTKISIGAGISRFNTTPSGFGLQLADYDQDGRLDCAVIGSLSVNIWAARSDSLSIYRNEMDIASNAPPQAPVNLSTVVGPGTVTFHWGNATDDITPPNLLTYNLRVGTNSLGTSVVSPLANVTNGWRKVAEPGNCGHIFSTKYHLPPGTYYWSMQAVDGAFAGGAWAPEQTFTITEPERPMLGIDKAGSQNKLHWPARFPDYGLQQAASVVNTNWTGVTNALSYDNGKIQVAVTNSTGAGFYRLSKP